MGERPRSSATASDAACGPAAIAKALAGTDVIIKSPGVSLYRPEIRCRENAASRSRLLLNLWFAEQPDIATICVTGTKGKSTTASLIAHMMASLGRRVALAGNIGDPDYRDRPPECGLRGHRDVELPGRRFRRHVRCCGPDVALPGAHRLAWHGRKLFSRQDQFDRPRQMPGHRSPRVGNRGAACRKLAVADLPLQ